MSYEKFKYGVIVKVSEAYRNDEVNAENGTTPLAVVESVPSDNEELVVIQYNNGVFDAVPQSELDLFKGETKTISLPCFGIVILIDFDELNRPISGDIDSTGLKNEDNGREDEQYNAAIYGIEQLVLAHAMAEIDVTSPQYIQGLETVINLCMDNYLNI
jgi:hypothetical protein